MPSLIPGYEYDIFISYRQKDNKHDGWVTKFVDNLKGELEATFKEDVALYFDENPHDRLQETHNGDKSLEGKLKCIIFIPILSQTYCDPNSYAWQYEFLTFLKMAGNDPFGKDIRLKTGNVASRILPIRIHDLEQEDIKLFEKETGSVLRTIDFIFKTTTGVCRPLLSNEDHPNDNLNKTFYRDQINKVAHAIKEIIQGMNAEPAPLVKENEQVRESFKEVKEEGKKIDQEKPAESGKHKLISTIAFVALLIIAVIIAYPKIFKRNTLDKLQSSGERISVAVMPFQNLTNDTIEWNVYQEIIQNSLTSYLSNFPEELQVRQTGSINNLLNSKGLTNYALITPSFARKISQTLEADVFVYGNIIKSGDVIRFSTQLIDTKTEEIIKSFQIEGLSDEKNFLPKIDSLSRMVKDFLEISKLKKESGKEHSTDIFLQGSTNSPEAYKYFIYASKAGDNTTMRNWLYKAVAIDSNFFTASYWIIQSFSNQRLYDQAKKWCLKLYKKKDQFLPLQQLMINSSYASLFETQIEQNKYLWEILKIDDQQPMTYFQLGWNYRDMHEYDNAIPVLEKGFEIYEKWDSKASWLTTYYRQLGLVYHFTGRYNKEKELYEKVEKNFPDALIILKAVLAFTLGDTIGANSYIDKFKSVCKKNSVSEANIIAGLTEIYSRARMTDKAKEYCRKLLSFQSLDSETLDFLAYCMVEDNSTLNEALELADRLLESNPEHYRALHRKGWALYKQAKYKEALDILQKSWDIRMKTGIYNADAYLHLEAAKKAVANLK